MVLRRPPLGHVLATAHDMAREHRIIAAVGRTSVPVAPALGLCEDPDVNGAPFYVMGFVDGVVLDSADRAAASADGVAHPGERAPDRRDGRPARRRRRRRVASVTWRGARATSNARSSGGRPVGRTARRGNCRRSRRSATVSAAVVPQQQGVAIAHGDYRFGNVLTDVERGRITAVLDWELCTLGDPLADLGYLGVYWSDGDAVVRNNDPTPAGGFLPWADVVERYAARTGRDVSASTTTWRSRAGGWP